jgi:predicted dehydrogenase
VNGRTPSPARRLRTAVIGTGFVGPHHVDAARRTGYADVVAIAGSDPERTARCAVALGVGRWTTDAMSLIGDPDIDVVHVCTPNASHVPLASACLDAGKHLVLEKPVAIDVEGAEALVEKGRASGRHAMVALTYRGYPMVRRARTLVASDQLGAIRIVHGSYVQGWLAEPTDYNWRIEPEAGGSSRAVADIGTHWFDTAEFISGRRVDAVIADVAILLPTRHRPRDASVAFASAAGPSEPFAVRTEDAATILLRFEGGAMGCCAVSQVSAGRNNAFTLNVDGASRSITWHQEVPERLWLHARSEARLLVRNPVGVPPAPGTPSLPAGHPEGWGEALRDLLRPFHAAIAAGADPSQDDAPYPTLADGARGVAFVAAVLESRRLGAWVRLGVRPAPAEG